MMKRKVAIVLAFMALLAFPARAFDFAIRLNSGDTLYFEVSDAVRHLATVVPPSDDGPDYYKGHGKISGVLVIPSEVIFEGQSYTVTTIGERAFSGCTDIRMVSIPSTVTTIGSYAFYGCTGINDPVVIGENVTRVGLSAFYGCTQLPAVVFKARRCEFMGGSLATSVFGNCGRLKKVTIAEEVTRIPDYAFCGVDALSSNVSFPESLEYIGDYAFSFCSKLSGEIVIPDHVTAIGECAFNQCHAVTALILGAAVDTIGGRAFYKCINLRSLMVRTAAPPRMESSSFSDLHKSFSLSIPCVSKQLYENDDVWKGLAPFKTHGNCTFTVQAEEAHLGEAMVFGAGNYMYGDSVTLVVACAAGYAFEGWSDGNRENPRTFIARENMKVRALTRGSKSVAERETVYKVDTVYSEGCKLAGSREQVAGSREQLPATISYDAAKKRVEWDFPEGERLLALMVYNDNGECIYRTDNAKGKFKMKRFPTGSYFVRIETVRRTLNYRFFMNNEE